MTTERAQMRLQVLKNEVVGRLDAIFRKKVQLDEEVKENEVQLQFARGMLYGLTESQKVILEAEKAEKIEELKVKRFEEKSKGDGDGEVMHIPPKPVDPATLPKGEYKING